MEKIKQFCIINKTKILFTLILMIAIFTRVYKLNEIPYGVNVDEAGMAYDAYCLANYGTDRYLNKLPVYLMNFGCGQSALYAYLAAFFIKIFGFSIFVIRLPAVILGIVAIVCCYLIAKEFISDKFALTFMALVTICPWHIMASRWGLDCNLLAPMSIISLFLLVKAKKKMGYIIAGISFGLTLYTYALSYIILPIFLIAAVLYMLYTKKITFKNVILMSIPIIILACPLILFILVNKGLINEINGVITIQKLWCYRDNELEFKNIFDNLTIFNKLYSNDSLVYNAFPEFGTMYFWASFLTVFGLFLEIEGLFKSIKSRKFEINSLFLFLYIAVAICMLIILGPNISKANAIFIPSLFFACSTIRVISKKYKIFLFLIVFLYYMSFGFFIDFYFNTYSIKYKYQPFWEVDLIENIEYINENFEGRNVIINTNSQQPYIYTLMLSRISPYEFKELRHSSVGYDFSYGKYYFYSSKIDKDAVYLVKGYDSFVEILQKNGFKIESRNSYIMAYK